jgi:hypothetical protein
MKIQSVRDLKLELALDVFAPLAKEVLDRAMSPKLGAVLSASPLNRVALGIARGTAPGEFSIAVRLQAKSALLQSFVDRIVARAGREVDIDYVGRIRAFDTDPTALRKICRPLVIGCSVAHVASTAGTLGLIARHRKTGRTVMVSNSHVFAQAGQARIGDGVTQPGRLDGGGTGDHVAALLDFAPFKNPGANQIDAAIALIDDNVPIVANQVAGIGAITVPDDEPLLPGVKVSKLGRTTGLTHGEITATELDDIAVDYDIGTLVFDNQIEVTGVPGAPFSDRGDSGSLVVDDHMRAIGLIFCGNAAAKDGAGLTYANHLPKVMAGLDLIPI